MTEKRKSLTETQQSAPELIETVIEDTLDKSGDSECNLCAEVSKQEQPQHKCRKCGKVVCHLFCSIRIQIHKPGDVRCLPENFETSFSQGINLTCPNCVEKFSYNTWLDDQ